MFHVELDSHAELRLLEIRHAEALFSLIERNRADLRQWLPWVDNSRTVEDARSFIGSALRQFAADEGLHAGLWQQANLAGVIGFHPIDWPNRSASLGYWLGQSFRGQGLMTLACRNMIAYAFLELRLDRIEIRCASENTRSRAIPRRLGFAQEGILRQAQRLATRTVDLVVYSLLASEWKTGPAPE